MGCGGCEIIWHSKQTYYSTSLSKSSHWDGWGMENNLVPKAGVLFSIPFSYEALTSRGMAGSIPNGIENKCRRELQNAFIGQKTFSDRIVFAIKISFNFLGFAVKPKSFSCRQANFFCLIWQNRGLFQ